MHYLINEYLIKSENAATSTLQTNSNVLSYISSLPTGIIALDYGCGKCRYSKQLNQKTSKLVLVDSEVQIRRKQTIHGKLLTVFQFAEHSLENAKAYALEDETWKKEKYDFILCTNVLSAIPSIDERYTVLKNISQLLAKDGISFISVQYRNSYFLSYDSAPNAKRFEDGWIIKKGNSYTFYGIITPNKIVEMCEQSGLHIIKQIKKNGSVYLVVRSENNVGA